MGQIVKVYKDGIGYQVLNTDNIGAALEAGDNISINGNEISAVDTTYSAGTGLSLSGTTFSLNVDYGADLSLSIDPSTFVLTAQLKNQNGGNIGTAQTIDLPLESVVVSGSYNAQTKEVELTLQSGSVIRFSVADLVSGLQEELVVGNGINIDANNEISVDTSVIATKDYVDDSIAESVSSGPTAPSNPTQGMLRYDTVNDVLKSYDGTQWNEVGNESTDINTKAFYLSGTSDLTNAQAAYDWFSAGKNPIVMYNNRAYLLYAKNATQLVFQDIENSAYDQTSYTEYVGQKIIFTLSGNDVTAISYDNTSGWSGPILRTDVNYSTPYTPTYAGSPTTKQYVDNNDTYIGTSAPTDNVVEGRLWYDTTDDILKVYDGSGWIITGKVYTAGDHIQISNSDVISTTGLQEELVAGENITIAPSCHPNTQGPAPDGYHIPTYDEWAAVSSILTSTFGLTADISTPQTYLKMPDAGSYSYWQGTLYRGSIGRYWCAHHFNTAGNATQFIFSSSHMGVGTNCPCASASSLRCFKDISVIPDNSWTVLYQGTGNAGIFHNVTDGLISISGNGTTWYTIQDKNLGATTVYNIGDTLSDANCGGYFQRGNNYGFLENDGHASTQTQVDTTGYGPGNYYSSDIFVYRHTNWSITDNYDLWGADSTSGTRCETVISATDTKYTAGTGISIDANNVISSTGTGASWGNITGTLSDQTDLQNALNNKADITDVLEKTNTTSYTPTGDYNPATKKYVDDAVSQAGGGDMLTTVYDPNNVGADAFDYTNFINTPTAGTGIDITNNTISVDNTIAKAADAGNVRRFENTTASLQAMYDWLYNSTGRYGIVQYNNRQDYIFGSTNATDGRVYSAEGYKVTNLSYSGKRLLLDKYNIYYTLNNGSVSGTLGYVSSGAFVGQDVAFAADVLTKTNTTAFTPTADYHPATKKYVDDSIAESVSSGTTAPSNPTEGQLWYDTTNDVLKVYDGTNWNAVNTDTTYSAGTGLILNGTTFSADTTVLATKQDIADLGSFEVVASLPSVISANTKTIYLLGPIGTGADKYEEWIVTEDSQQQKQWTKIGETSVDLSGYATTSDLTSGLAAKQDTLTASTGINIDSSNNISNTLPGPTIAAAAPTGTEGALWYDTTNDVLMAHDGTAWKEAGTQMKVLSYGHSTWQDFLDAYNENAIVYCKASSNSNPGSGAQGRMAFMAFIDINSSTQAIQGVEFQYYRSRSSHSTAATVLDEVYIYKLSSNGTWTVTQRDTAAKPLAGTGIGLTYNASGMTISADTSVLATQTDLNSKQDTLVSGTNIKTVNNESLLGTGNITISAPTYTAGDNIIIDDDNEISAIDTTYNAGPGIEIGTHNNYSAMQGPCQDGFHIPNEDDLLNLYILLSNIGDIYTELYGGNLNEVYELNIPPVGFVYYDGVLSPNRTDRGTMSYTWVSDGGGYQCAEWNNSSLAVYTHSPNDLCPMQAMPIRAFKDKYVTPDSSRTTDVDMTQDAKDREEEEGDTGRSFDYPIGIFHNSTLGIITFSDGTTCMTIADKNLGATTTWNDGDNLTTDNCGNIYQWGNCYGFTSAEYGTTGYYEGQKDASNYGPGNYYSSSEFVYPDDGSEQGLPVGKWDSSDNQNLRGGETGVITTEDAITNIGVLSVNGHTGDVTITTPEESNTKTFYLSSTSDLTNAQAALDWYLAGKNPILMYGFNNDTAYILSGLSGTSLVFKTFRITQDEPSMTTATEYVLIINRSNNTVTSVTATSYVNGFLQPGYNYASAYTPTYNGSPATKKYVDDNSFKLAPNSPLTPKYRRYGTQAQYEALSQYYTDTPGDTVYHTT